MTTIPKIKSCWLPVIALLMLVLACLMCGVIWLDKPEQLHNVRWFFIKTSWLLPAFTLILFLSALVLGIKLLYRYATRQETPQNIAHMASVFLLMLASLCSWIFILPQFDSLSHSYLQFDSLVFNNHVYIVDGEYQSAPLSSTIYAYVVMWECDRLGWWCSKIYSEGVAIGGFADFKQLDVELAAEGDSVVLKINRNVVYRHTP